MLGVPPTADRPNDVGVVNENTEITNSFNRLAARQPSQMTDPTTNSYSRGWPDHVKGPYLFLCLIGHRENALTLYAARLPR